MNKELNTITITVTAVSGNTQTYTITATRAAASTNAALSNLTLDQGSISPTFSSGTTSYTASVPYTGGSLPGGLSLAGDGVISGVASKAGSYTFTVMVTDSNGDTAEQTYTMTVAATTLPTYDRKIEVNGELFGLVPSLVINKTTYMPIWYVEQVLALDGITAKWNGSEWDLTTSASVTPTLLYNNTGTPVYVNGVLVLHAPILARTDPSNGVQTTYMPIWYVQQVLKALGVKTTWNGRVWNFNQSGVTE